MTATVAKLLALPPCAICKHMERREVIETALYDFKMKTGSWAYGCEEHYLKYRLFPDLGTGKGQKLEVDHG